jgi:hypothetical protein
MISHWSYEPISKLLVVPNVILPSQKLSSKYNGSWALSRVKSPYGDFLGLYLFTTPLRL